MTLTRPLACAGVRQVMVLSLTTTTLVAGVPPKVTLLAPVRLAPLMVTAVSLSVSPSGGAQRDGRDHTISEQALPGSVP